MLKKFTQAGANALGHTRTHTNTHAHKYAHIRTYTHTHTNTPNQTYTHTHTHTQYAFAIMMFEVFSRTVPYAGEVQRGNERERGPEKEREGGAEREAKGWREWERKCAHLEVLIFRTFGFFPRAETACIRPFASLCCFPL